MGIIFSILILINTHIKYVNSGMHTRHTSSEEVKWLWNFPKTFLRIGSYYKTTIDNLKIMNHLKLLTKYN